MYRIRRKTVYFTGFTFFHYLQFSFKHNVKMRNKNVVVKHIFFNVPDKEKNCIFHRVFFSLLANQLLAYCKNEE